MLGRTINSTAVAQKDFSWPFLGLTSTLSTPTLTLINLESPLINSCPVITTGYQFCGSNQFAPVLKTAGVDLVNFANNHNRNFGSQGYQQTLSILQSAGINVLPSKQVINDISFTFLGFDDVTTPVIEADFVESIKLARASSALVIVSLHWGQEYQSQPTPRQIKLGHLAIDSGAILVVGHHPHWIQPIEPYKSGYIYYSLGNFIFDQFWSTPTQRGLIVTTTFDHRSIISIKPQVVFIDSPGIPRLLPDADTLKYLPLLPK
jgi:poly-gamma-glutamate synthesis protein (capsule biosynthesis protein)